MKDRALPGPIDYPQIPALAERGLARLHRFFAMLDAHLVGRIHITTDRFTLADITAVVAYDFARAVRVRPGTEYPAMLAWRARMAERPSMVL